MVAKAVLSHMQRKRGRERRWPLTDDGRYKCTDCEKTYSSHKGALKHWNKHHKEQSSQATLFPESEENICSKKKCSEYKFDEFHLCIKHLTLHEDRARESLEKNYIVNKEGCWIYKGSTNQIGYAVSHSYNLDSRDPATIVGAYKLNLYLSIREDPSHDLHNIPLSQYGDVHHSCKVRNCINPEHLIEMSEELHTVLHNLHIRRIAKSVLNEFSNAYPEFEDEINNISKNL